MVDLTSHAAITASFLKNSRNEVRYSSVQAHDVFLMNACMNAALPRFPVHALAIVGASGGADRGEPMGQTQICPH
jgi:hypothetical protein